MSGFTQSSPEAGSPEALGYKLYLIYVSQTGLFDPSIDSTVSNTTGVTPAVTRDDIGNFWVSSVGLFPEGKTVCSADNRSADKLGKITIRRASDDVVTFQSYNAAGVQVDDMLLNNWIRIEIYP